MIEEEERRTAIGVLSVRRDRRVREQRHKRDF